MQTCDLCVYVRLCLCVHIHLWYEADMNVAKVLPLHFELKLSEGFDEWHTLNVSHGPSKLHPLETDKQASAHTS